MSHIIRWENPPERAEHPILTELAAHRGDWALIAEVFTTNPTDVETVLTETDGFETRRILVDRYPPSGIGDTPRSWLLYGRYTGTTVHTARPKP